MDTHTYSLSLLLGCLVFFPDIRHLSPLALFSPRVTVSDYRDKGFATVAMMTHWITGDTTSHFIIWVESERLSFLSSLGAVVMMVGFLLLPQTARRSLPPAVHRVLGILAWSVRVYCA